MASGSPNWRPSGLRLEFLEAEKELTRSDEVARQGRYLDDVHISIKGDYRPLCEAAGAIPLNVQGDEQGISVFIKDTNEEANGENDERLYER
jgi:hypothetical protein